MGSGSWRWVTAVAAGVLASAALTGPVAAEAAEPVPGDPVPADPVPGLSVAPVPGGPVSLAQAGEVIVWGDDEAGQTTVPAALEGVAVRKAVIADSVGLALTAEGQLVSWGFNQARLQRIPEAVHDLEIVDVAASTSYAGVVDREGRVHVWGVTTPIQDVADVPPGLRDVQHLSIGNYNAAAVKADGTVVAWGHETHGINQPPTGLRAKTVSVGSRTAYALTEDGTVVGWGSAEEGRLDLPPEVQEPGNVLAVVAQGSGGLAVLKDHTLTGWGHGRKRPASLTGVPITAVDTDGLPSGANVVLTPDGVFHRWLGPAYSFPQQDLSVIIGRPVAHFSVSRQNIAVVATRMLRAELPRVTGVVRVGSTLTGAAGTFSASPDAVSSRWLANGAPITGATGATLKLTPALVGKRISYESTATKAGAEAVVSRSVPTAAVKAKAATKTATKAKVKVKVNRKATRKKAGQITATITPTKGKAKGNAKVKGKVRATLKIPGIKKPKKLTKKLNAQGKTKFKLPKAKKKGPYKITIQYLGNKNYKPSKKATKFKAK